MFAKSLIFEGYLSEKMYPVSPYLFVITAEIRKKKIRGIPLFTKELKSFSIREWHLLVFRLKWGIIVGKYVHIERIWKCFWSKN